MMDHCRDSCILENGNFTTSLHSEAIGISDVYDTVSLQQSFYGLYSANKVFQSINRSINQSISQ